jgi:integrase
VPLIYRGRSIGVRVTAQGQRKWLGSVKRACQDCDGQPAMCRRCRAEAELEALRIEERGKRQFVWRRESCRDFAERWLTDFNEGGRWDASTLRGYREILKRFSAHFGNQALGAVTPAEARSWSQTVPSSYVRCARAMFNDAMRDDLIDRNPFAQLRLEPEKGRSEIVAISESELHDLCELAVQTHGKHGATVAAMIAVAGYTAIRPAELFAIEPSDVRLSDNELDVRQQWTGHEIKAPKSKKPRTVVLPSQADPYLSAVPRHLGTLRLPREKGEPVDVNCVFRNKQARIYQQSTFSLTWAPIRSAFEAKLSPARARELRDARDGKAMAFYELRHLGCTEILRRGGSLEDAANQLGHADTTLVQKVYGHLEPSVKLDRIKRLYAENVRELRSVDEEAANG